MLESPSVPIVRARPWLVLAALVVVLALGVAVAPVGAVVPGANGLIVFSSNQDGEHAIWVMQPDGSGAVNLTPEAGADHYPVWSPDGTKIAFTSWRDGNAEIYVMNVDGSGQTNLTNHAGDDREPAWSPDGTQIAFTSFRDGNGEVYVMAANGTGPTNLTNYPSNHDSEPTWSPDGTQIAYTRGRIEVAPFDSHIMVMAANGTGQTNLTVSGGVAESQAAWSPDGTKIAFTHWADPTGEVFVMNPDGSGQTPLTTRTDRSEYEPAWSPDGTMIAYNALGSGTDACDIFIMNADGSDQQKAARRFGVDFEADWQPTAKSVFVSTTTAGMTDDGLAFGPHDIIEWDGAAWSRWFDGTAAGLKPSGKAMRDVTAFWIPDPAAPDVVMSFTQNSRIVPGVGKVMGSDLVRWDGSAFSLWFDGSDVGLSKLPNEKIDALHVLPGKSSPIGAGCQHYLLLSTFAGGQVSTPDGPLAFSGEDVLGFCLTNVGAATAGRWHKVVDGSDEGMPANSLNGLSRPNDGRSLLITTRGPFAVDAAAGGHSMFYRFTNHTFSGPVLSLADIGLHQQVDGQQWGH